jgi:hypothetical protein
MAIFENEQVALIAHASRVSSTAFAVLEINVLSLSIRVGGALMGVSLVGNLTALSLHSARQH